MERRHRNLSDSRDVADLIMVVVVDENSFFSGTLARRPNGTYDVPEGLIALPANTPLPDRVPARWTGKGWDYSAATTLLTPEPDLALVRKHEKQRLRERLDEIVSPIRDAYPKTEVQTWDQQAAEAEALIADATSPAPMIRSIAQALGQDPVAHEAFASRAFEPMQGLAPASAVSSPLNSPTPCQSIAQEHGLEEACLPVERSGLQERHMSRSGGGRESRKIASFHQSQ